MSVKTPTKEQAKKIKEWRVKEMKAIQKERAAYRSGKDIVRG